MHLTIVRHYCLMLGALAHSDAVKQVGYNTIVCQNNKGVLFSKKLNVVKRVNCILLKLHIII